ncbi:hypothetical protein HHL16_00115 [Pseudoflavitalea sp. G-6-1-2]|uniref:hypothetical protein n=1 Tax=Pseudoflavitalea sp. G-6-1-2 TaxID=2728841 RepID=UPI00146BAE0E|nr:hypothetical protein [Pseudoflavitalea sp. G-6-1-2]NML19248.1 hypothetical protein [Pseudoflavitalea sp. G-6-1-2]
MQLLASPDTHWSSSKKIAFRLCFLYFALYIFFTPNNDLPVIDLFYEQLNKLLDRFIPWFAKNVFGYKGEMPMGPSGSGDTTYDYMLWFFTIILTIAGTIIWTIFDRHRKSYNTLYYWIRVIVRYYLFYTMVIYGSYKVIKLQFPYPSLLRLVQPYGDSSPMGLAWTYMGYSDTYNYFTGFAELLGGVLLLTRRTTTLGAIVCLGVMSNVFMINMGYDVPVKLLSFNTILMSIFLIWKDGKKLAAFFFQNKPTTSSDVGAPYTSRKARIILATIKWLIVAFVLISTFYGAFTAQSMYGAKAPKPPLYGIYYTEDFTRNNETVVPLTTDTTRWKRLIIPSAKYATAQLLNDSIKRFMINIDTVAKTVEFTPPSDTLAKSRFSYKADPPYLTMSGVVKNDTIRIRLKRFDEKQFLLMKRGFHWVNEFPYNR